MEKCHHPPLTDITQLLICRTCHAAKVVGILRSVGSTRYYLDSTPFEMIVDPVLVGKRVRVTIEALPDEDRVEEVVTGAS